MTDEKPQSRMMTAEELRRHLKLDELIAAGYRIEIVDATIEHTGPSYSFSISWIEWPSGGGTAPD